MSTDEYMPEWSYDSETGAGYLRLRPDQVSRTVVLGASSPYRIDVTPSETVGIEFLDAEDAAIVDAWLGRIRRDAAREALDRLADEAIHVNWKMDGPSFALRVRRFKNRRYPGEVRNGDTDVRELHHAATLLYRIARAWWVEGINPRYHQKMKDEVRRLMPVLAKHLDRTVLKRPR